MDWLKNNHPGVIVATAFCFGFAIFVYASFSNFVSYDAYWHLKMGQDLLSNGLSPRIDHYSFTFPGQPITSLPYLFQIILSLFVSMFGSLEGFQLIKMFALSLFMLAIYLFYKKIKAPWQIIVITLPYIFIFLLFRFNHVRPEIFDSTLVITALILYLKAKESFSHRNLAYIAVLQLFWVNYHAPILGYVIFFGLFLDKAIEILTRKDAAISWQRWASWGFIIFVIGFINPDFNHHVFSVLGFSNDWAIITEFIPTNQFAPNSSFFYVFWLVSAYLAISLVLQRQFGLALVCCIFAFQSWQAINIITISGIMVTSLLAYSLSLVDFTQFFKTIKSNIRILITVVGVVMAVSGIVQSVTRATAVNQKSNVFDFPVDIASYLKKTHPDGGNIFNRARDGGYLLYQLSPEFKVYIDGRTNILYPIDFVKRYSVLYGSENFASIADEIERYNIEFAIYPIEMAWFPLTDKSHSMSAEYASKDFILLSTRKNNFPLSSRVLFFPMCWQEANQPALAAESIRAKEILPNNSVLAPLIETLVQLNNSASPEQVFSSNNIRENSSRYHKRLLGYAALELRFYEHAFTFFESIGKKDSLDLLMLVYAALNNQNFRDAEENLLVALSEEWALLTERNLSGDEQAIAITLLEILEKHQTLSSGFAEQRLQMKQSLLKNFPSIKLPLSSVIPQAGCKGLFSSVADAKN
jgi:hypothetical protein